MNVSADMELGYVKAELRASEERCEDLLKLNKSAIELGKMSEARAQTAEEALALVVGALNEHDGVEPGMEASDDPPHERVQVLSLAIRQLAGQVNNERFDLHTVLDDATNALLVPLWSAIGGHTKFDDAESVFGLLDLRMKELAELRKITAGYHDEFERGDFNRVVRKLKAAEERIAELESKPEPPKDATVFVEGGFAVPQSSLTEAYHWMTRARDRAERRAERVMEYAAQRMPVTLVSLGDYVLNGGEVAVLAIVEAVARLLPGVIGNAESLVEESHEDGLLEYPVYTKPASWRGLDVPDVLLSGHHGAIAAWRQAQRVERTATRRPDLLPRETPGD